jgi:hypothetical protein
MKCNLERWCPLSLINSQQLQVVLTLNQMVPDEGPKAIPLSLDFSGGTDIDLDIETVQTQGRFSMIQALYVDMDGQANNVTVTVPGSNQRIILKPNTQGYYTVMCPNPAKLHFTGVQGQAAVPIFLINFPVAGHSWPTV